MEALAINRQIADEDAKDILDRFREDMDAAKGSAMEATEGFVNMTCLAGGAAKGSAMEVAEGFVNMTRLAGGAAKDASKLSGVEIVDA